MQITCRINNRDVTADIAPDLMLIDFLRGQGLKSIKCGCDTTNCGLCTVWVNDRPVLSCAVLTARVDGQHITTLEGLQDEAAIVGGFLADQGAEQCGYCAPGLIMCILAMEREFPSPSREQIARYLAGNLCRCSGYEGQVRAITRYFQSRDGEETHESS